MVIKKILCFIFLFIITNSVTTVCSGINVNNNNPLEINLGSVEHNQQGIDEAMLLRKYPNKSKRNRKLPSLWHWCCNGEEMFQNAFKRNIFDSNNVNNDHLIAFIALQGIVFPSILFFVQILVQKGKNNLIEEVKQITFLSKSTMVKKTFLPFVPLVERLFECVCFQGIFYLLFAIKNGEEINPFNTLFFIQDYYRSAHYMLAWYKTFFSKESKVFSRNVAGWGLFFASNIMVKLLKELKVSKPIKKLFISENKLLFNDKEDEEEEALRREHSLFFNYILFSSMTAIPLIEGVKHIALHIPFTKKLLSPLLLSLGEEDIGKWLRQNESMKTAMAGFSGVCYTFFVMMKQRKRNPPGENPPPNVPYQHEPLDEDYDSVFDFFWSQTPYVFF